MAKSQKFALPLPKKAIEADEVAKEKSYDEFYKELYVLFKKDKGERKPKLVKQVREHLKTFEGKKLLFDLLEHFEKRKDKYYNADQEKIIKIIKEEILIATKLPKDWKKKEAPQSDLPESLIPLDKTEENQDNTHVKSFKPFFLTTPEQQREVQLEADLSKAEQKIAQLEKEREETLAVLATLTEENRCRLEQIKELELRVEEAEQKQKKATDKPSICLTNTEFAEEVLRDLKAKKIKKWEDRSSEDPTDPMDFYKTYYQSFSDRMYQFILRKYDEKLIRAMEGRVAYLRKKGEKIQLQDYIPPKKESSDQILSIIKKDNDVKKYFNLKRSHSRRKKHPSQPQQTL